MMRFLIHSQAITKKNAKVQFQIKLPDTIKNISGVLAVIDAMGTPRTIPFRGKPIPFQGSLWLRIADKRDVFYADEVRDYLGADSPFFQKPDFGFVHQDKTWISGKKPELFDINVDVKNTLIEGFFIDETKGEVKGYKLKIYLKTNYD